jgi:hypothetical protein
MSVSAAEQAMGLNYKRRVIYQALHQTFADERSVRMYFDLWQDDYSDAHFVVARFASVIAQHAGFDAEQKSLFQRRLYQGLTQAYERLPRVPDGWIRAHAHAGDSAEREAPISSAPVTNAPPASMSSLFALDATSAAPPSIAQMPEPPPDDTQAPAAHMQARASDAPPSAPTPIAADPASAAAVVFDTFAGHLIAAIMRRTDGHRGVLSDAVAHLPVGAAAREHSWFAAFQYWSDRRFHAQALPADLDEAQRRYFAHQLYLVAADLIGPVEADRLLVEAAELCEALPEAAVVPPTVLL